MNELKDFTPKQAKSWVAQELAKATTVEKAKSRILSEQNMLQLIESRTGFPSLPNSKQAHVDLIAALKSKFQIDQAE